MVCVICMLQVEASGAYGSADKLKRLSRLKLWWISCSFPRMFRSIKTLFCFNLVYIFFIKIISGCSCQAGHHESWMFRPWKRMSKPKTCLLFYLWLLNSYSPRVSKSLTLAAMAQDIFVHIVSCFVNHPGILIVHSSKNAAYRQESIYREFCV